MVIAMKDKHVLSLSSDLECRLPLVRDILPQYLMARRWYASKEDVVPSVTIQECVPVLNLTDGIILFLDVKTKSGTRSRYFFPIRAVWECERPQAGVICELRAGAFAGWLVDGFSNDEFVRVLLEGIRHAEGQSPPEGGLAFYRAPTLDPRSSFKQSDIHRSGAEQSNTSVIADDVILKAFRKLEPGIHPELEVGRYLTNDAELRNVPSLLGSIEFVSRSGERTALCVLQSLVRAGTDGWKHVTRLLNRLSTEGRRRQSDDELVTLARALGKSTAELHQAFAAATDNPDFKPELLSQNWFAEWEQTLDGSLRSVSEKVAAYMQSLPDRDRALASSLLSKRRNWPSTLKVSFPSLRKLCAPVFMATSISGRS